MEVVRVGEGERLLGKGESKERGEGREKESTCTSYKLYIQKLCDVVKLWDYIWCVCMTVHACVTYH